MTTIKNPTRSPFTVVSLNGPVHVPAFGEAKGEFAPEYLALLKAARVLEVVDATTEPGGNGLADEYTALSGKQPDKRWSDKRLAEEVLKLKGE